MSETSERLIVENAHIPGRILVEELTVSPGECLVLCGPNGSGKSSLLRMIAGLENDAHGHVRLGALDLLSAPRNVIASKVAWLPQRPYLGEFITCESIVAAARFRFGESSERARAAAVEVLESQGIAHLGPRPASQVSGGELQRVLIAALIAQDAPLLLVDEPANHLDPRHQVSTYRRLGQLWSEHGRTVILVTHDVRLARLLGRTERVRVQGVKEGRLLKQTTLADQHLGATLAELYGVRYVDPDLPGGLSIDLDAPLDGEPG